MSETTSKLSLFKYNTTADAKQPFSINDCLNDNWDKLDAFATSVDTIFSSSFSSNLDKKVFSDINKELGNKLEADVLLAENGYIKFNNGFIIQYGTVSISANAEKTVTLSLAMKDTKYCPMGTNITFFVSDRYSTAPSVKKTSNTQITVGNIEDVIVTYEYMVCGF